MNKEQWENSAYYIWKQKKLIYVSVCIIEEDLFQHYDKYCYYIDEEIMREVESYLAEMMIADDETYRFWKNEIIRLINPHRIGFNYKYDYELSLVYKGSK